jgi:hypothetical protein
MAANCIPFSNKTNDNEYSEDNETINLNDDLISNNEEQNIQSNEKYDNNLHVGILKCRKEEQERKFKENISATVRKQMSFVVSLFYLPTIICNIHFMETNDSCLYNTSFVDINLYKFLLVDTIGSILTGSIFILFILYNIKNNILEWVYNIYIYVYFVYLFIWLIVGSVIFWVFTDRRNCNEGIYIYLFVLLVLKCVFQIFNIMRCVNIYKNKNNQDITNNNTNNNNNVVTIN